MKHVKWVHFASVLSALALMALPWSVNDFYTQAATDGSAAHEVANHYAYYQIAPFLNGHVGPLLTAVLTALLLIVVVLLLLVKPEKPLAIVSAVLSGAGIITSVLCVVPHGVDGLTAAGVTVLLLLVYSLVMSIQRATGRGFVDFDDDDDDDE